MNESNDNDDKYWIFLQTCCMYTKPVYFTKFNLLWDFVWANFNVEIFTSFRNIIKSIQTVVLLLPEFTNKLFTGVKLHVQRVQEERTGGGMFPCPK